MVTRTLHVAPQGAVFNGYKVPAGMEIFHYFPVNYRDTSADSTAVGLYWTLDLLSRTLALVSVRPEVRQKIEGEIASAGLIDQASPIR